MGIERFYGPHRENYASALEEVGSGKKRGHWMWYIFPQIKGLGKTETSVFYAIQDLQEAKLFLADDFLGGNLRQICSTLLKIRETNASEVFGFPDDRKLQSSMTLFSMAEGNKNNVFQEVLQKFFNGEKCAFTYRAVSKNL